MWHGRGIACEKYKILYSFFFVFYAIIFQTIIIVRMKYLFFLHFLNSENERNSSNGQNQNRFFPHTNNNSFTSECHLIHFEIIIIETIVWNLNEITIGNPRVFSLSCVSKDQRLQENMNKGKVKRSGGHHNVDWTIDQIHTHMKKTSHWRITNNWVILRKCLWCMAFK